MFLSSRITTTRFWRLTIQWAFFTWILFIGVQFGRFVYHFTSQGQAPLVNRPPGVEGFLPIGALAGTKFWALTGTIHPVHPAAVVLFVSFVAMSLLAKKSFCSWLCPVGTLSESIWKLGQAAFGENFRLWRWLDLTLRSVKYLLLLFFLKLILLDMPMRGLSGFLGSPYWAMSDVKMLHFFTGANFDTIAVLSVLIGFSLLFKNAWCRYLCPYGALLGLVSMLSPFKIRRHIASCTSCGKCAKACPSMLPVDEQRTIHSPECTGCLSCVETCPHHSLQMAPPKVAYTPKWVFPVVALGIYVTGIGLGMATGHWQSVLSYADYALWIPRLSTLGF
nr:4Fe-4S binding protein [uncultured Desulfuromonas sp.]